MENTMNFNPTTKDIFNVTDFTLLDENVSKKDLSEFFSDYKQYAELELSTASFCVYPNDLITLATEITAKHNPCVVINFPHADQDEEQISNDIAIAAKFGAEIDLVFPTVAFLEDTDITLESTQKLLSFYKAEIDKHNELKVVKMIFDTTHFLSLTKQNKEKLNVNMLSEALELTYKTLYSDDYKLFFKTSTGKIFKDEDHTKSVKLFNAYIKNLGGLGSQFNKNLGIKVSGGVSNQRIVQHYLNSLSNAKHYMENDLFRIGASGLLSNLQPLPNQKEKKSNKIKY
jgi:deoxyribose-phosphate aldolase